eukprot:CAMPEP_0173278378 /NCGR_PEP_ID=MMETSP1143-20121109/4583_1 /TAXON_ID=483371 /ORGANISM="non described non described, Strain CCMP2298" /LENGTH=106 /DNA_ID=CAMNT_0014215535 /DNA_START=122 /DNA_END=439 /DNA_ORIENTATION=+
MPNTRAVYRVRRYSGAPGFCTTSLNASSTSPSTALNLRPDRGAQRSPIYLTAASTSSMTRSATISVAHERHCKTTRSATLSTRTATQCFAACRPLLPCARRRRGLG